MRGRGGRKPLALAINRFKNRWQVVKDIGVEKPNDAIAMLATKRVAPQLTITKEAPHELLSRGRFAAHRAGPREENRIQRRFRIRGHSYCPAPSPLPSPGGREGMV